MLLGLVELQDNGTVAVYDKELESSVAFNTNYQLACALYTDKDYFTDEIIISSWYAVNTHKLCEASDLLLDVERSIVGRDTLYDVTSFTNFENIDYDYLALSEEERLKFMANNIAKLLDSMNRED